jgi:hypothetical protein
MNMIVWQIYNKYTQVGPGHYNHTCNFKSLSLSHSLTTFNVIVSLIAKTQDTWFSSCQWAGIWSRLTVSLGFTGRSGSQTVTVSHSLSLTVSVVTGSDHIQMSRSRLSD